jgi:cyclopropane fatty-acyl-phospholipid synthase-like methyltransferase
MKLKPFDKYDHYIQSVQSPDIDIEFFARTFKKIRGRTATTLREDFCGTFILAAAWVKKNRQNEAIGLDLDPEPIRYGRQHFFSAMTPEQQLRLFILQENVMTAKAPAVDVIVALNFSYYLFKKREELIKYFTHALKGLKKDGIMVMDCFGGPACQEANIETKKVGNFQYFWQQESYDPISNEAVFHIHFKRKGERKRENVFTYDWRMWTIAELREAMETAGFKRTSIYWEGTSKAGEGNGVFTRRVKGEECQAWVAYVVGEK